MDYNVKTCFILIGRAEEAARFYVSLFPNSQLGAIFRQDPAGPAIMVEFTLNGRPHLVLNVGPDVKPNEAASLSVTTPDQVETDRLWNALVADGGRESRCGWLTDRFGLSWQVVPEVLPRYLMDKDRAAANRAMQAMLGMAKIDIAAIEAAFAGR